MMRRLFLILILALGLAAPVASQARNEAIPDVIQQQIEAFLRDDFAEAFTYASPMIKRIFGSSERFGAMVRQGYPMVWRPADVEYLDQTAEGGATYQTVRIRDLQGNVHFLSYEMIETGAGWQINGVRLLEPPGVGA